jgi:hypothetical protein
MRLSEAIMLGSATVKMAAGDWNSCALGAACNALGMARHDPYWPFGLPPKINGKMIDGVLTLCMEFEPTCDRRMEILKRWPWTGVSVPFASTPTWCQEAALKLPQLEVNAATVVTYISIVTIGFDHCVVAGKMTLEQLVDWVRSVEPSCGECCSFECGCEKTQARVAACKEAEFAGAREEAVKA